MHIIPQAKDVFVTLSRQEVQPLLRQPKVPSSGATSHEAPVGESKAAEVEPEHPAPTEEIDQCLPSQQSEDSLAGELSRMMEVEYGSEFVEAGDKHISAEADVEDLAKGSATDSVLKVTSTSLHRGDDASTAPVTAVSHEGKEQSPQPQSDQVEVQVPSVIQDDPDQAAAETVLDPPTQVEVKPPSAPLDTADVPELEHIELSEVNNLFGDDQDSQPVPVTPQVQTDDERQTDVPPSFLVSETRNKKIVTSMAESMLFYEDCLTTLASEEEEEKLVRLFDALQDDSMSTAFTGIEAAGTCLFQNIQHFFRDEMQETVQMLLSKPHLAVEILGPLIASKKCMKNEAYCLTHKRICAIKPAKRHIAGTSCRPYSRKGSGLSQMDPETIYTLAWIGQRVELQEPIVASENVKTAGGPTFAHVAKLDGDKPLSVHDAGLGNLIIRFLAEYYWMEATVLDPSLLGFPFSREREFIIMRHKVKCLPQISPLSRFQRRFFRACSWSWKDILMMHMPCMQSKGVVKNEGVEDIKWARSRPTCRMKKPSPDDMSEDVAIADGDRDIDVSKRSTWEMSLTESEFRFLETYRRAWPNTAYQLNQDPSSGHGHKAGEHAMFTLFHNCGLVWSDTCTPPRWMTATELLMCQGFPVVPFIHDSSDGLSVFSFENPKRTGRHVAAQAGNSMHCAVMGLIQLHSLSEIPLQPVCPLFKTISDARTTVRSAKKRQHESGSPEGCNKKPTIRVRQKLGDCSVLAISHGHLSFL
eukprot:s649_g18.t1